MEDWQVHRLYEVNDETGERLQTGGAIVRMSIGAVNGPLHEVSVQPVTVEEMQEEQWDGQFVRMQVADRVVWMEPKEVELLIHFLKLAYDASLRNCKDR